MKKKGAFQELSQVLSRLFMGRVSVRGGDFSRKKDVHVLGLSRRCGVFALPSRDPEQFISTCVTMTSVETRTSFLPLLEQKGITVREVELVADAQQFSARGSVCGFSVAPKRIFPAERKVKVISSLDRMLSSPQRRKNSVRHLQLRFPGAAKTGIIAFFSPLIKGCVLKTTLDKRSGTLWVWMDSRKAGMRAHHLLLLRDPGEGKFRWVWMEAGKNKNIFGGGDG